MPHPAKTMVSLEGGGETKDEVEKRGMMDESGEVSCWVGTYFREKARRKDSAGQITLVGATTEARAAALGSNRHEGGALYEDELRDEAVFESTNRKLSALCGIRLTLPCRPLVAVAEVACVKGSQIAFVGEVAIHLWILGHHGGLWSRGAIRAKKGTQMGNHAVECCC